MDNDLDAEQQIPSGIITGISFNILSETIAVSTEIVDGHLS